MGASVVRRGANAQATLAGGTVVAGIFTRAAVLANVGIGMRARDVSLRCITADLTEPTPADAVISILHQGNTSTWRVAEAVPQFELGQTLLILSKS